MKIMPKTIDHTTIAAIERNLSRYLNALESPVPSAKTRVAEMSEADYDEAGLAVARIMKRCAEYLEEAGFDAHAVVDVAEYAEAEYAGLIKRRLQECPGCAAMPGESDVCTGTLNCEAPQ
jgi:hypothetical protein